MITTLPQSNGKLVKKKSCVFEDSYQLSKTTADFNSPDIGGGKADDDDDPMSYFAKLADS